MEEKEEKEGRKGEGEREREKESKNMNEMKRTIEKVIQKGINLNRGEERLIVSET